MLQELMAMVLGLVSYHATRTVWPANSSPVRFRVMVLDFSYVSLYAQETALCILVCLFERTSYVIMPFLAYVSSFNSHQKSNTIFTASHASPFELASSYCLGQYVHEFQPFSD